jgi:hypothetical protein
MLFKTLYYNGIMYKTITLLHVEIHNRTDVIELLTFTMKVL